MYSHEEALTRIFFGRVAGRKLSDSEVKAIVSDVKRIAEIIRRTPWLRRALREGVRRQPTQRRHGPSA